MRPVHIRAARPFDAGAMAALLGEIIEIGGTTALRGPLDGAELRDWMAVPDTIWHVAELGGDIAGFQWVEPKDDLPADTLSIATFARPGRQGLGIGSALFQATRRAAKIAGYRRIHAIILPHNESGRSYYRSRGFERLPDAPDGRVVKAFRL